MTRNLVLATKTLSTPLSPLALQFNTTCALPPCPPLIPACPPSSSTVSCPPPPLPPASPNFDAEEYFFEDYSAVPRGPPTHHGLTIPAYYSDYHRVRLGGGFRAVKCVVLLTMPACGLPEGEAGGLGGAVQGILHLCVVWRG